MLLQAWRLLGFGRHWRTKAGLEEGFHLVNALAGGVVRTGTFHATVSLPASGRQACPWIRATTANLPGLHERLLSRFGVYIGLGDRLD